MVMIQTMLVMKRTTGTALGRGRLSVAEAKARLSEVLRNVNAGPTVIHNRGRDAAVLLGVEAYERLIAAAGDRTTPMGAFLRDVEALEDRLGGGAELDVERAALTPHDPFGSGRRQR
jgi:prevent-host-death family protein